MMFVHICRGENVSEFKPPLDIILMSDVVYYEEVLSLSCPVCYVARFSAVVRWTL